MEPLPEGTITFFFSDIEGSTRLAQRLGKDFKPVLEEHDRRILASIEAHRGRKVRTIGDAFFVVFVRPDDAVAAAVSAQRALAQPGWPADAEVRVRMGMHTGWGERGGDDYVGLDVHLAARIAAAAHGGQIVVSDATKAIAHETDEISFRELGSHRLKDVGAVEVWQVVAPELRREFPALASLEVPSNLPAEATSFVGREQEVADVRALVRGKRLVTLTGPGGTGKTRLSLRVASELVPEFPHGVYFVPLAPISDAGLVPATIAEALTLPEEAGRTVTDALKDRLRTRSTLLVLDNFEQVVAASPLVGELIAAAPRLRCLASSREVLHLYGEQEYPVPSLSEDDAVDLFAQRAREVRPDFALTPGNESAVRAICARLDRLPLAIELAAARTKVFTPESIGTRLDSSLAFLTGGARDLPERQRTLRGAIAWSHDLLGDAERTLFRRLAVFGGGCRIESAEAVCDPDGGLPTLVADVLASLVDKSLLRCEADPDGETRFRMLETIREYARERLDEAGETAGARRRHAEHFQGVAENSERPLMGSEQVATLARLNRELDNLRTALAWSIESDEAALGLRIAGAIWRFWQIRGHLGEGRASLDRLIALPSAAPRDAARAKGLAALGGVAYWQGDFASIRSAYEESLAIYREIGDRPATAEATYNLAFVPFVQGDMAEAQRLFEEGGALYQALSDDVGFARTTEARAAVAFRLGDYATARALEGRSVERFRELGLPSQYADSLTLHGLISHREGDDQRARADLREAATIQGAAGDTGSVVGSVIVLAIFAAENGDAERAARLVGAAAAHRERHDVGATAVEILGLEGPESLVRRALGDERARALMAEGRALTLDQALALGLRQEASAPSGH